MDEQPGTPENQPTTPENQAGAAENTPDQPQGSPTPSRSAAPAAPRDDQEPSHVAVGVGVIDGAPIDSGDHHGQDGGRDTMTAGEAQREGALGTEQEQRLPAMAQNNATQVEKVSGIVVQTRSDVGDQPQERIEEVLRQRLEQSGIDLPDAEIAELARQISGGDD
jgi:hypothetical protein